MSGSGDPLPRVSEGLVGGGGGRKRGKRERERAVVHVANGEASLNGSRDLDGDGLLLLESTV